MRVCLTLRQLHLQLQDIDSFSEVIMSHNVQNNVQPLHSHAQKADTS
jgi:hypothetical protein